MLSNWTISSLIVKGLSAISAPRFGTHIKILSLLYLVTLLAIPSQDTLSIVSEAIPYPTGLRDFLAPINTKLSLSR